MDLYLLLGLGIVLVVNLLLVIGLTAYHFTVTTAPVKEGREQEQWEGSLSPELRR